MTEMPEEKAIIVYGNPVDGIAFEGPFDSHEAAVLHATDNVENSWWIGTLHPPLVIESVPAIWCRNCGQLIHDSSGADPEVPWVHLHSRNAFCDVSGPADAVELAGTEDRMTAEPAVAEPAE